MQQIVKAPGKIVIYVVSRVKTCVKGAKMTLDRRMPVPVISGPGPGRGHCNTLAFST
jgi:methyl coenzyme M reductase subunit C-like uncharacterized protein (methanogenesis marker protein 7)